MCALSSRVAVASCSRSCSVMSPILRGVLGDQGLEVGDLLADRPVLRVVADAAAVTHRVRVLPRRQQGLELGAERFEIHWHGISAAPADSPAPRTTYGPFERTPRLGADWTRRATRKPSPAETATSVMSNSR